MARAQALRLGPFVGGMNAASDPTAVADSELVDCVNFELDIDGSLTSRPPIKETAGTGGTGPLMVIGRAVIAGVSYLIVSREEGGVWSYDGTTFSLIASTCKGKVALQYRDNVYVVASQASAQNSFRWDGTTTTFDANMPRGEAAVFHKTRMFIVPGIGSTTNTSRLYYSDVITAAALTWGSFTDISPGDGQNLVDIVINNDNLLLFKQDSTYVLAYDLQPTDAIVRAINSTIGASKYRCVAVYENSVFTYHEGFVYEIVNYDFARISVKVPFVYDGYTPATFTRIYNEFLCTLGDRLIVRYYNRIYVFNLKTRTWTRWEGAQAHLHNFGPVMAFPTNTAGVNKYYAGSCLDITKMFIIQDGFDATTTESTISGGTVQMTCSMTTKNYDLADSHHFKKMMWWGADILTNQNILGKANPIISTYQVTWSQVSTYTWGDLAGNTWGQPLTAPSTEVTSISDSSAVMRKFTKFLKTLRFRQINYYLELKTDGSTTQGPCRVFTLTAIVASKQTVGKQVN